MKKIYKYLFKIKKEEILLFLIIFIYLSLRTLFSEKLYFFVFLFEIYFTISVYSGIKKSVYDDVFSLSEIFKEGLYFLPSVLLYHLIIGFISGIIYLMLSYTINSIKTFSFLSFILFFLIIIWGAIPLFFLFLTVYTPFIIISEEEILFDAIVKSFKFMKENLSFLICLFFPFLVIWFIFFTNFQKYDKIFFLKIFLLFFISFLEILTIKLVFLAYKERGTK